MELAAAVNTAVSVLSEGFHVNVSGELSGKLRGIDPQTLATLIKDCMPKHQQHCSIDHLALQDLWWQHGADDRKLANEKCSEALRLIQEVGRLTGDLDLSKNDLTDDFADIIFRCVQSADHLTGSTLNLEGCLLTDAGIRTLARHLQAPQNQGRFRRVKLLYNPVADPQRTQREILNICPQVEFELGPNWTVAEGKKACIEGKAQWAWFMRGPAGLLRLRMLEETGKWPTMTCPICQTVTLMEKPPKSHLPGMLYMHLVGDTHRTNLKRRLQQAGSAASIPPITVHLSSGPYFMHPVSGMQSTDHAELESIDNRREEQPGVTQDVPVPPWRRSESARPSGSRRPQCPDSETSMRVHTAPPASSLAEVETKDFGATKERWVWHLKVEKSGTNGFVDKDGYMWAVLCSRKDVEPFKSSDVVCNEVLGGTQRVKLEYSESARSPLRASDSPTIAAIKTSILQAGSKLADFHFAFASWKDGTEQAIGFGSNKEKQTRAARVALAFALARKRDAAIISHGGVLPWCVARG
jgi:hypothetical protein